MSNVVALAPQRSLREYSPGQLALIRRTVAKDATPDEFDMFMEVCRRVGLDPFRKQIYCLVYNKNKPEKRTISFITAIDGFRGVAARNKDYRADDEEPQITYDEGRKDPKVNPLGIVKAVVRAYKLAPDGWHPQVGTAYWDEFAPITEKWAEIDGKWKPTGVLELDRKSNWYRMPRIMIAKVAEAQALRKGWPEDLSGIYAPEEMDRNTIDGTASELVEEHATEQRMLRIGATNTVPILWEAGKPIEAVPVGEFADRVLKFLKGCESPVQVETWRDANQIGLNQFWALHKSDALALKQAIEGRIAELTE